ncbi:hypothetical protein [Marinobacter santoriniensis]|uniref:hypothetical protein n=1 Tax=Marinobacter santoriniensis TaxID=523742 RepID=UPI00126A0214|nr:hypothetical protein [Marinobacter santoriniensis]
MRRRLYSNPAIRISVFSTLIVALLFLFSATSAQPALELKFDGPASIKIVSVDGSGDSPSSEPPVLADLSPILSLPESDASFCVSLEFIQPPERLLSYPALPQGPPALA